MIPFYILWFFLPAFFVGLLMFAGLEKLSGRKKAFHPKDLRSQVLFLTLAGVAAAIFDYFFAEIIIAQGASWEVPAWFMRILPYPIILITLSFLIGPSEKIQISDHRK